MSTEPWGQVHPIGDGSLIRYGWTTCSEHTECPRDIDHLLVWHWCVNPVDMTAELVAEAFPEGVLGWMPSGVGAHTLVQEDPLTLTASLYWPECCGVHGFITEGKWVAA
jgi:hypothetical protein